MSQKEGFDPEHVTLTVLLIIFMYVQLLSRTRLLQFRNTINDAELISAIPRWPSARWLIWTIGLPKHV